MESIQDYTHDDAMIAATRADGATRTAVYAYAHTSVVLGRGSKPDVELNLETVRSDGVELLRRRGGGCAVVLDPGNVVVAVTARLPGLGGSKQAFARLSDWLIQALDGIGVTGVCMHGISDLTLGDRKIGGACIHRSRDLLYYSTTLLVTPDLDLMERYLRHPPREPEYRDGRSHHDFVTTLRNEMQQADPAHMASSLSRLLTAQGGPHL